MADKRTPEPIDYEIEEINRELARQDLMEYATYLLPWFKPAAHHRLVATYLEQVVQYVATEGREGIGRLIISLPVRTGKTEEVSKILPSWFLGKLPDKRVALIDYGADLAEEDSKAVRDYVMDPRYAAVFGKMSVMEAPVEINPDASSKSKWDLAKPYRGGVIASGIGGALTGFGAHLMVIGDPYKSREDADSVVYRRKVLSWYKSVAYQRLEKGGAVIITHTRWHPEDLAGELIKAMVSDDPDAEQWTILTLPSIAYDLDVYPKTEVEQRELMLRGIYLPIGGDPLGRAPGEPLWPEKFDLKALKTKQTVVDDVDWMSLDQQMPISESGEMFTEGQFDIVDTVPEELQWSAYVDLALGKTKLSDMNGCLIAACDKDANEYWRDLIHVRALDEFKIQLKMAMLAEENKGCLWYIESTGFQYVEFKEFMSDPDLMGVAIFESYPTKDKVMRARPVQSRARAGKIKLVRAPWNKELIRQFLSFPRGQHDDLVDVGSGVHEMIANGPKGKKKVVNVSDNPFYRSSYASVR